MSAKLVPPPSPEASLLTRGWRLLPVSSCGHPSVRLCVLISHKDTSQIGSGSPLVTSFHLSHLCKDPVSKHIMSEVLGVRTATYKF